jgi:hypothetical protein
MRTGTTLSVYSTPWSLLTNSIHETRNHSISLYNIMVSSHQSLPVLMYGIGEKRPWCCIDRYNGHWSHVWDWWEETMVLDRQIEWSLVSYMPIQHHGLFLPIPYMRTGSTLCLCNTMVSSHQFYAWDQEPLYLSIQHHSVSWSHA